MTDATEKAPGGKHSPGRIRKRSVLLAGHTTSVSLEEAFWRELAAIAKAEGMSLNALISRIDRERDPAGGNLSSAVRLYVLGHVKRG